MDQWSRSTIRMERMRGLVRKGLLPGGTDGEWILPPEEDEKPEPSAGYVLSFPSFHERGFAMPPHEFLRRLLIYYDIELHHLDPNGIQHIAAFIALCEAYLGIDPHFKLWQHFFAVSLNKRSHNEGRRSSSVPPMGCASIRLRGSGRSGIRGPAAQYMSLSLPMSTDDWHKEWFYLKNDATAPLPRYSGTFYPVAVAPAKWKYKPKKSEGKKLRKSGVFTYIDVLKNSGLKGIGVIGMYHERRVAPLMARAIPMYRMEPTSPTAGTVITDDPPSHEEIEDRLRKATSSSDVNPVPLYPVPGHPAARPCKGFIGPANFMMRASYPPLPEDDASRDVDRAVAQRQKKRKEDEEKRSRKLKEELDQKQKHLVGDEEEDDSSSIDIASEFLDDSDDSKSSEAEDEDDGSDDSESSEAEDEDDDSYDSESSEAEAEDESESLPPALQEATKAVPQLLGAHKRQHDELDLGSAVHVPKRPLGLMASRTGEQSVPLVLAPHKELTLQPARLEDGAMAASATLLGARTSATTTRLVDDTAARQASTTHAAQPAAGNVNSLEVASLGLQQPETDAVEGSPLIVERASTTVDTSPLPPSDKQNPVTAPIDHNTEDKEKEVVRSGIQELRTALTKFLEVILPATLSLTAPSIQCLRRQHEELASQLKAANQQVAELATVRKELESLRTKEKDARQDATETNQKLTDLLILKKKTDDDAESVRKERDHLQKTVEAIRKERDVARQVSARTQQQIEQLKAELQAERELKERAEQVSAQLSSTVTQHEEEMQRLVREADGLADHIAKAEERTHGLEVELDGVRKEQSEHEDLCAALRVVCNDLAVPVEIGVSSLVARAHAVAKHVRKLTKDALRFGVRQTFTAARSHYSEIDMEAISQGFADKFDDDSLDKIEEEIAPLAENWAKSLEKYVFPKEQ